jgi:hypothetical protein
MNRAKFIEKFNEVQQTVGQLLAQLQSARPTNSSRISPRRENIIGWCAIDRIREKGYRARSHLKLPDCAGLGIQGRLPRLGALAADFMNEETHREGAKAKPIIALTAAFVIRSLPKRSSKKWRNQFTRSLWDENWMLGIGYPRRSNRVLNRSLSRLLKMLVLRG